MDWETVIGWGFSIISIGIAIYQSQDKKKYKSTIRLNSWILLQRVSNLGGVIQKAFNESTNMDIEKSLYEKIVRSDALAAELYKEAFRLITLSEPKVNNDILEKWKNEGRISESDSDLFKKYLVDDLDKKKFRRNKF